MNEFIQLKVYRNTSSLANTMADIDEKVREIKEVEKGINRLFDMIKELHHIISTQNTVVDSIAEKVDQIQDHVQKTHTTTVEAKELYMGYREVCSIERMHFVRDYSGDRDHRSELAARIVYLL